MSFWTRHVCEIHGHVIEGRLGWLGGQYVILDGKLISSQPLASIQSRGHFFEIVDEAGKARNAEVRFDSVLWGLKPFMVVSIDGVQRARLPGVPSNASAQRVCRYCGYSLGGLEPENREYRCPECGRHTPAVEVGA
jgi:hypothetical protein